MASFKDEVENKLARESGNNVNINEKGLTAEEANKYYLDENYEMYLVEYVGDLTEKLNAVGYGKIFNIGLFFAILFVEEGRLSELLQEFPEIINIERSFPFTTLNLDESSDLETSYSINKGDFPLDGEETLKQKMK